MISSVRHILSHVRSAPAVQSLCSRVSSSSLLSNALLRTAGSIPVTSRSGRHLSTTVAHNWSSRPELPLVTVVTASSNSGEQAVRSLLDQYPGRVNVRACFRTADKAKPLEDTYSDNPSFESMVGITANTEDQVAPAFKDATYAIIVTPHDMKQGFEHDASFTANMIRAAAAAGVQHVVYVGSWTVNYPEASPALTARFLPSEQLLESLGDEGRVRWTSLRGGYFMNNFAALKAGIQAGAVKFPDLHIPVVDPRDIGRLAAAILAAPDPAPHHKQCYEVSGPELLTVKEVVAKIAAAVGKENVSFESLPAEQATFVPPFLQSLFLEMEKGGRNYVPFSDVTKQICGEHTSLDTWLQEKKGIFQG